jgi:protein phosphatase
MTTLEIHDPTVVVLIGPAGSGKSTLATQHFAPDEILSSDAFRALVSGDESNQAASPVAFRILHRTLARRLGAGLTSVVDATNIVPAHRRPTVGRARAAGAGIVAIVLDLDAAEVHARNAARTRVVDRAVVERHLEAVRQTVDGDRLRAEGFVTVVVLRSPADVDALVIERHPVPVPVRARPTT